MSKTIEAVYDGEVLRPDEPLELHPNTRVRVTIDELAIDTHTPRSFLRTARSLNLQGPPDWSERIEEYLIDNLIMGEESRKPESLPIVSMSDCRTSLLDNLAATADFPATGSELGEIAAKFMLASIKHTPLRYIDVSQAYKASDARSDFEPLKLTEEEQAAWEEYLAHTGLSPVEGVLQAWRDLIKIIISVGIFWHDEREEDREKKRA